MINAETVARAICEVCPRAGQALDVPEAQTSEERTQNLLRGAFTGPYLLEGDPHQWGGEDVICTIYLEQQGGSGDCEVPLEYYGDGHEVAIQASRLLGYSFIEFINAAVACVYPG